MRIRLTTALAAAGLTAAALAAGAAAPQQALAASGPTVTASAQSDVLTSARTAITELARRSGAGDHQYLAQGRFLIPGATCPRCEVGPAVAAAALYRRTGDASMRKIALTVMDRAIKDQIRPDGSFAKAPAGESDNSIQTVLFAQHLGAMLTFFGPTLDGAHRKLYTQTLVRAANVLVKRGWLTYYVNGNLNLAMTVVMGQTWKQTGSAKFKGYYEKSLAFTLKPGKGHSEFGLKLTRKGTKSLGRDSRGYLAEKGAGKAGFDPEYTHFQADIASLGYVTIGDSRLLMLSNVLTNQLLTRVNKSMWVYDITGGSRKARTTGADRFSTAAYSVAVAHGRPGEKAAAVAQVHQVARLMRDSAYNVWPPVYQSWGSSFATTIYTVR